MAAKSARCAALVGPYLSGKTTLLESILFATQRIPRKGNAKDKNTVGDASAEARARGMSTELNVASAEFLGDNWTFLDCPGSIEFQQDARNAMMVADAVIVVAEPNPERAVALAPLFKFLDDHGVPHLLFVNKIDQARGALMRDLVAALQDASERPLVLRQVPIRSGDDVTGYVDLVSERAYRYKPGAPSELVQMPGEIKDRESEARQKLLESLSDFDDKLLEQLLEESVPARDDIYKHLTRTLQEDKIVPVFLGSAANDGGVLRLLKALRHEAPAHDVAAARLELQAGGATAATVFKTFHMAHSGKLSLARIWGGAATDGMQLSGHRVGGLFRMLGHQQQKIAEAKAGDIVAMGRMEGVKTGQTIGAANGSADKGLWPEPLKPLFALAIEAEKREDEVKITAAIAKMVEEDPSLSLEQNAETREMLLWGQGEMHLRVAIDKLKNRYNITVKAHKPLVAYRETIKRGTKQHARHKRQTGGHGQFADVQVEISPLSRGSGFEFVDNIVGGRIPRQFIPAVEEGIRDYLSRGPLGFPVVDLQVSLFDGQYHTVDSSDMAFKTAGALAMREGMPKCDPVLLEPIFKVRISAPSVFTSNIQSLISGRRGHILGFDAKSGWKGWDEVQAHMPQSEIQDLVIELRSLTQGVGTFEFAFDHLQELSGRMADQVVQHRLEQLGDRGGHAATA
ncbi:MAG: elongation factor G [Rhodospirillaceae bacterium]|nr:elongation factor G [Rhodospirillaceae bacterium]